MRHKVLKSRDSNRAHLGSFWYSVEFDACREGETWRYVVYHFYYGGPTVFRNPNRKPLLHKGKAYRK